MTDKPNELGEQGVLVVQEGHVVITEISGKLCRIVGRGITWLKPFERISMIVPLFPRCEKLIIEQVVTKDQMLIEEFEISVFHKVDPGPVEESVPNGGFPYNPSIIIQKIWNPAGNDWRTAVLSFAETALRDIVGQFALHDLFPLAGTSRIRFVKMLTKRINRITQPMLGVVVSAVDIGRVKILVSDVDALRCKRNVPADTEQPTTIPVGLYEQIRQALLDCGPFNDDRQLLALFAHPLLSPWQNGVPQADTRSGRVDGVIDYLRSRKRNDTGEAALVLLLQVLVERTDPGDECHGRLARLTDDLRKAI